MGMMVMMMLISGHMTDLCLSEGPW